MSDPTWKYTAIRPRDLPDAGEYYPFDKRPWPGMTQEQVIEEVQQWIDGTLPPDVLKDREYRPWVDAVKLLRSGDLCSNGPHCRNDHSEFRDLHRRTAFLIIYRQQDPS